MQRGLSSIMLCILVFLMSASDSHAVVPGMWPFLQSLMSFLPQIILFVLVGMSMILKFSTWKSAFRWIARKLPEL